MKNRQIFFSGCLEESIYSLDGTTLNFHNVEKGELAFGDIPNRGKVEVVVPIYQWDTLTHVLSGRCVFLTGYLQKSVVHDTDRTAKIILRGASPGDIEFLQIIGPVEVIVPLYQRIIEPEDAIWCEVTGGSYYLINKHKVLAVIGERGAWTLRVGPNQEWRKAETWAAGKKAVLDSLAIQELEGFRYSA